MVRPPPDSFAEDADSLVGPFPRGFSLLDHLITAVARSLTFFPIFLERLSDLLVFRTFLPFPGRNSSGSFDFFTAPRFLPPFS